MAGVKDQTLLPLTSQQITTLTSSTALTVPAGAKVALIQAEGQAVRFRDDGTNPTASLGIRLLVTSDGFWYTGKLHRLRFIEEAASAKLNVAYYA